MKKPKGFWVTRDKTDFYEIYLNKPYFDELVDLWIGEHITRLCPKLFSEATGLTLPGGKDSIVFVEGLKVRKKP